ncbi:MAG: Na/Pi symporter [Planctomycetota bacterium]
MHAKAQAVRIGAEVLWPMKTINFRMVFCVGLLLFFLRDLSPSIASAAHPDATGSVLDQTDRFDWPALVMGVLGGLAIFLLGVERLTEAFSQVGDARIRTLIDRFTSNIWSAVLTGAVACTVLDSSSATIIMVIAMIRGGLLTFEQSLGLVMGANIGTTIGAQIIALDVFGYAPLFLIIGLALSMLKRTPRQKNIGIGLIGAGLIFFGLGHLEGSVSPLRNYQPFLEWVETLGSHPTLGAFAGCLATLVIQSSSATVGIAIVMAKADLVSIRAGVAVMLGAEIGTVSNTLVASVGRGREAIRCAVFHLFFNLTTVIVGLMLIGPLIWLAELFAPGAKNGGLHVARSIANAQVIFNVLGVLAFIPLIPWIARFLIWQIPNESRATDSTRASVGTDYQI